jgi:large subunit ribosomal protein L29
MKISELRGKTIDQLKESLINLKKESFNLRFQKKTGELENTSRIREVRRSVAAVKTLMNEFAKKNKESTNA